MNNNKCVVTITRQFGSLGTTTAKQDKIFNVESGVIESLAEKESCIIVGRCSDYVLRGMDRCINGVLLQMCSQ